MNGNGDKTRQPIGWLKGHLRDEVSASKCLHLHVESFFNIGEREAKSAIEIPGKPAATMIQRLLVGLPAMGMVCSSPRLVEVWRAALPPDLAPQLMKVQTGLEICRLCPFLERPQ